MCSRHQFTNLTYMGGTGLCLPMTISFGSVIKSYYTSLNIKFSVNRTIHVLKTPVNDLTYMGGTGPCGPMMIVFSAIIQSQYTSLHIKFCVNRTFHVLKTPVYRFYLYERYHVLCTDDDNFWQYYLESAYKPKYKIWCESDVPCTQDPSLPILLIWEVPGPVHR